MPALNLCFERTGIGMVGVRRLTMVTVSTREQSQIVFRQTSTTKVREQRHRKSLMYDLHSQVRNLSST